MMSMCPACIEAGQKAVREGTAPAKPSSTQEPARDMDIGRIVKMIGVIEGVLSVIIALVLVSNTGDSDHACIGVPGFGYSDCLSAARAAATSAHWIAAGWAVGGIMAAMVIYCIGHIACRMDENNRLLLSLQKS